MRKTSSASGCSIENHIDTSATFQCLLVNRRHSWPSAFGMSSVLDSFMCYPQRPGLTVKLRNLHVSLMDQTVYQWQNLTTRDFDIIDRETSVAILPMAAIEQHGPHLPLSTDAVICQGILDEALSAPSGLRGPIIVMPLQTIGDSLEHTDFRGTLSHSTDILTEIIFQLGACINRSGIDKLLIFNSHGGQSQVIDIAALRLRHEFRMFVAKTHSFRLGVPDGVFATDELAHGLHGGAVETSMMLHLAPDLVRLDAIENFRSTGQSMARDNKHLGPESRHSSFAWMAQDLNRAGPVGDAASADADKGRLVVSHAAAILRDVIHEVQNVSLSTLASEC